MPLDDAGSTAVEELRGDVRDRGARAARRGADVLVHAAAALPIQVTAPRSVRSTSTARRSLAAALEAGVGRVVLISSTAVYGVPDHHPIHEDDPLVGVGHYGGVEDRGERLPGVRRRGLEAVVVRPKTFVGPERLGVFEILFDWIREGRRIPILGDGSNRYQLLAVEDLVEAVVRWFDAPVGGEALNVGAARFGTVREDLEVLIEHAGSGSRLRPVPARPAELALRALELARLSPLAEWHYRTAQRTRSSRSTRRARGSAGSRRSRTRRRCARRTTGTSRIGASCAPPGRRTACRGTSARSACSNG